MASGSDAVSVLEPDAAVVLGWEWVSVLVSGVEPGVPDAEVLGAVVQDGVSVPEEQDAGVWVGGPGQCRDPRGRLTRAKSEKF
ncbi:MAG TPA: hypothetical protein VNJ01_11720 [Bacteriovoracaceae bacterium]|nr:hypothetical protein [Bacteriovoracaceae bacterium]